MILRNEGIFGCCLFTHIKMSTGFGIHISQREDMEYQSKHRIYTKNEMRWKQIIEKQEQDGRAYGHLIEVSYDALRDI